MKSWLNRCCPSLLWILFIVEYYNNMAKLFSFITVKISISIAPYESECELFYFILIYFIRMEQFQHYCSYCLRQFVINKRSTVKSDQGSVLSSYLGTEHNTQWQVVFSTLEAVVMSMWLEFVTLSYIRANRLQHSGHVTKSSCLRRLHICVDLGLIKCGGLY